MLTFGNVPGRDSSGGELDELFGTLPDVIECGENNDYWIRVVRSTKKVEFVSKQTGAVTMRAGVFPTTALLMEMLTPAQLSAIRSALKL